MSESTPSSEPASGNATPEPTPKPKKGKSLWMVIAAILVALILVGTYFFVLSDGDDDDDDGNGDGDGPVLEVVASITPAGPVTAEAGSVVMLYVTSSLRDVDTGDTTSFDGASNVTYRWSRSPITLGDFDSTGTRYTNITVSEAEATGTVTCNVSYVSESLFKVASVTLNVNPPYFVSVEVVPVVKTILIDDEYTFTARAWNSVGDEMEEDVDFEWSVSGLEEDEYDLSATTGASVVFSPLALGTGTALLNVTATSGDLSDEATATITITDVPLEGPTVDYYWYDLFNVPFGEWYDWRAEEPVWGGSTEDATYPYIYDWYGDDVGNIWNYTLMMMDITATDLENINTAENTWFLPHFGTTSGGHAVLDWRIDYLTYAEAQEWPNVKNWYDGWIVKLSGTTTLDEDAAMMVLGVPEDRWADFDTWWTESKNKNNNSVNQRWEEEFLEEQGNEIFDIYAMYDWHLQSMVTEIWAKKVGDEVVLTHRQVSWGMEALMARWLSAMFMDGNEWYFDGFEMQADIGPETTDISITTGVQYAAYAYETTMEYDGDVKECWMWEALRQDYIPTWECEDDDWISWHDPYVNETYVNYAPGSVWYGDDMPYDYAPGLFNLTEGQTLTLEWPADDDMVFVHHIAPGEFSLVYGPLACDYSEPRVDDFTGQITIDSDARTIEFVGPIDMYTWSKTQTWQPYLADEWTRLGKLPYGAPTIEFRIDYEAALRSAAPEEVAPTQTLDGVDSVDVAEIESVALSVVNPVEGLTSGASVSSEMTAVAAIATAMFLVFIALGQCVRRLEKKQ